MPTVPLRSWHDPDLRLRTRTLLLAAAAIWFVLVVLGLLLML